MWEARDRSQRHLRAAEDLREAANEAAKDPYLCDQVLVWRQIEYAMRTLSILTVEQIELLDDRALRQLHRIAQGIQEHAGWIQDAAQDPREAMPRT